MPNRRDFLKSGALAGAGAVLANGLAGKAIAQQIGAPRVDNSYTIYAAGTPPLTKWTQQLISAIPTATAIPGGYAAIPTADYYEISMEGGRWQFHTQLLVTSPKKFTTWGYKNIGGFGIGYLGPTIEAKRGVPVVVRWINTLPDFHPIQQSLDPTVPEVEIYGVMPGGRVTPHLHGGLIGPQFDGHPHSWWTKRPEHGTHFQTLPGAGTGEAIFYYTNNQPATMLWYHDHAMGATRTNVYAGLAALYFLRDTFDTGNAANTLGLPFGAYEVPLVLQDKTFNIDGSLFYPIVGVTPEHPIWMPEFFGDTPVINGLCYPNFNVEPRRYRFRVVNGSQARFYNFWITKPNKGNLPIYQIGAEQGFLPAPYLLPGGALLIAPGERADIIVDFTGLPVGTLLMMNNDANAPFPGGGGGPNIPELMQFTVVPLTGTDTSLPAASIPLQTTWGAGPLQLSPVPAPIRTREIVMIETQGLTAQGNQMAPTHVRLNGRWFDDLVNPGSDTSPTIIEETPVIGTAEQWDYINTTADTHPMHTHLVAYQVINRQAFNAAGYLAAFNLWISPANVGGARNPANKPLLTAFLVGAAVPPLADEAGYKDTVKCPTGLVTRVKAKYDVPDVGAANPLIATTLPARYVYHCHILEHEENEMMRPFAVTNVDAPITTEPRSFWKPGAPDVATVPTEFALEQNYPNPFNPETTIRFSLPEDSHVELKIFNSVGQDVATVVNANYVAGSHSVNWNAVGLASGVYFAKLTAGKFAATKKMMLMK